MNRSSRAGRALGVLGLALAFATTVYGINLPKPPSPPKPGERPELPETQILDKLPEGTEMPEPGQSGMVVSCLQKGNMDITRPSLPLLSCWESATNGSDDVEALNKACTVQMTPMKVDSTLVPKCPPRRWAPASVPGVAALPIAKSPPPTTTTTRRRPCSSGERARRTARPRAASGTAWATRRASSDPST